MADHPIIFQDWSIRAIRAGTKTQTRRVVIPQPRDGRNVTCTVCGERKAPTGRSIAPETYGGYCTDDCNGYRLEPPPDYLFVGENEVEFGYHFTTKCPYGVPGDTLWVRETHYRFTGCSLPPSTWIKSPDDNPYQARGYIGEDENDAMHENAAACVKVPSIHMPRWASRIDLTVKSVRVERVQDITADDCQDEGIERIERAEYEYDDDGAPNNKYWVIDEDAMIESYAEAWDEINIKPRARMRGGEIAFYESFPWDGEREAREHRGKPWHVYPNPAVWRVEWPPYQAASI